MRDYEWRVSLPVFIREFRWTTPLKIEKKLENKSYTNQSGQSAIIGPNH